MKNRVITCPVHPEVRDIVRLSGDLTAAFRRLRRRLKRCRSCPAYEGCPLLVQFGSEIQAALAAVREEMMIGDL